MVEPYIDQFEAIIRHHGEDPNWTLPYWDWSRNPQIPAPFWEPGSALNHPRNVGPTTSMPSEFIGEPVIRDIMDKDDFQDFARFKSTAPRGGSGGGSADLESRPHNSVHRTVGQDMASFMSPRDPIFWLHHCNIDRIWASWNAAGNANSSDPDLADFVFDANTGQFVNPDGTPRSYIVRDIYTTQGLDYGYDRLEPAPADDGNLIMSLRLQSSTQELVRTDLARSISAGGVLDTTVALPSAADKVADTGRIRALSLESNVNFAAPAQIATARLALRGLKAPAGPDTSIRVFINCDYLTLETPLNDPHFVGLASFFLTGVAGGEHAGHGADFVFDITETLDALRRRGTQIDGQIRPQVLAVDASGNGTEIAIDGAFEITIETLG